MAQKYLLFYPNFHIPKEIRCSYLFWEDPPEKEMASHSNILVWEIP